MGAGFVNLQTEKKKNENKNERENPYIKTSNGNGFKQIKNNNQIKKHNTATSANMRQQARERDVLINTGIL